LPALAALGDGDGGTGQCGWDCDGDCLLDSRGDDLLGIDGGVDCGWHNFLGGYWHSDLDSGRDLDGGRDDLFCGRVDSRVDSGWNSDCLLNSRGDDLLGIDSRVDSSSGQGSGDRNTGCA